MEMEERIKILRIYEDYQQACRRCPNAAAHYEAGAGAVDVKSILLEKVPLDDVLKKIISSDTLWKFGYHNYLSNETKKEVILYKIKKLNHQLELLNHENKF
jgi:hypothetical protein